MICFFLDRAHHRAMNRMMNSFFPSPAGPGGFGGLSLMGPQMHPQQQHQQHPSHHHHQEVDDLMPFGGGALSPFGGMFGGFPDMVVQINFCFLYWNI